MLSNVLYISLEKVRSKFQTTKAKICYFIIEALQKLPINKLPFDAFTKLISEPTI